VTKDLEPEELADAIRTVSAGGSVLRTEGAREAVRKLSADRPEGTVTLLFTDIEGSTGIVERLGDEEARGIFRDHDRVLRAVLGEHGGVEVDHEGDAFMFAFTAAEQGVGAAVAMQRALAARAVDRPDWAVDVRMGMNTGEVLTDEIGYFGKSVFLAARVAGRAEGGQILASASTRAQAGAPAERFVSRGRHSLKGLRGTHQLYEVAWR
jgi:class 3 adenylate cyclase